MTATSPRIWILGASDPEMELIERILRECGERVEYATVWRDGARRRVTPAEAYGPDVEIGAGLRGLRATAYMVECAPAVLVGSSVDGIDWAGAAITIDHHRPGDPGYGQPPEEFLPASSIGQAIAELARLGRLPPEPRRAGGISSSIHDDGWDRGFPSWVPWQRGQLSAGTPGRWVLRGYRGLWAVAEAAESPRHYRAVYVPTDIILAAAADHCLAAAYRGECPGVDPDALMRWRVETRAKFQGRPVEDVLTDVERAREALRGAPEVSVGFNVDAPGCDYHGEADAGCGDCDYEGGAILVRDLRQARLVTTVVVAPFAEGATVGASGTGDDTFVVFDGRPEGAWDEGDHHTFVSAHIPELPEAAAREGVCFLSQIRDRDGREKVVCQAGTPEQIRAFMEHWAPSEGLVDIYGDPARGFAGGYLPRA